VSVEYSLLERWRDSQSQQQFEREHLSANERAQMFLEVSGRIPERRLPGKGKDRRTTLRLIDDDR
jgi:hypothetical protein